tara:strand:- start:169 stop:324 length:156 start_codon:yes stop_codon:yes gene_type:complete
LDGEFVAVEEEADEGFGVVGFVGDVGYDEDSWFVAAASQASLVRHVKDGSE